MRKSWNKGIYAEKGWGLGELQKGPPLKMTWRAK